MSDQDAVRVRPAPKLFGEFEVLVDLLDVGPSLRLRRAQQGAGGPYDCTYLFRLSARVLTKAIITLGGKIPAL